MNSQHTWCDTDGSYNCDAWARNVLNFAHGSADWVDEIEAWWTA